MSKSRHKLVANPVGESDDPRPFCCDFPLLKSNKGLGLNIQIRNPVLTTFAYADLKTAFLNPLLPPRALSIVLDSEWFMEASIHT